MDTNIFELAARHKFRFASLRGDLIAEQLFDLPLKAVSGFDLDEIAKAVNEELKGATETSFVETANDAQIERLTAKLEVVKFVIADKQAELRKQKERAEKRAKRAKLVAALDARETSDLAGKTRDELLAELEALD